ncbi:MAG: hypothetical protein M1828_006666 [Chrysothrix sp. TS-e1954]|nr:MAG: hypothetical protein M1828_006666 [Chrysothrix sp. TS-e1954]
MSRTSYEAIPLEAQSKTPGYQRVNDDDGQSLLSRSEHPRSLESVGYHHLSQPEGPSPSLIPPDGQETSAERKGLPHRISREQRQPGSVRIWKRASDWWTRELFAVLPSFACFIGVAAMCAYVQDRPLEQWHSSISPNAMISTLTTISKTSILLAIAQSISQLKWLHYRSQARQLDRIDTFNDASTSPLGAAQFLVKMKGSALIASVASVAIIAALAFEPMAQQVFSYPTGLLANFEATAIIPLAQVYDKGQGWIQGSSLAGNAGI